MKVLKVIVDKTPQTCSKCKFLVDKLPYYCRILDRFVKENIVFDCRPDWCPLILEEDVESWLMTRPQKPKYVLCDNKD